MCVTNWWASGWAIIEAVVLQQVGLEEEELIVQEEQFNNAKYLISEWRKDEVVTWKISKQ